MFNFSILSYIKLALAGVIIAGVFLVYKYVTDLQVELVEQGKTIALQQAALEENLDTINRMETQRIVNERLRVELSNDLSEATNDVALLRLKLQNHDLTRLAIEKPDSIERIINDATDQVFNDLEQLTRP